MFNHRITLYTASGASNVLEDSRPTKNASRCGVGQSAPFLGDRRASVRASRSAAHRLDRYAPGGQCIAYDRAPFAVHRNTCSAAPSARRLWPTRSIEPVERSRTFGPAATGGYKYRAPSATCRHFRIRCRTTSTHAWRLRFYLRSTLFTNCILQFLVSFHLRSRLIIHSLNRKYW